MVLVRGAFAVVDDWTTAAQFLTAIATFALLGVWVFYAKLFYDQHRERTRPWLLIHQDGGASLDAHCLLSNMSEHVAHITVVLAVVHIGDRRLVRRVPGAPWAPASSEDGSHAVNAFREGPLPVGGVVMLGTFRQLASQIVDAEVTAAEGADDEFARYREIDAIEVRVIAASPVDERGPLGAYRRFRVDVDEGSVRLRPDALHTPQLRTRSDKRMLTGWIDSIWEHDHSHGYWEIDE